MPSTVFPAFLQLRHDPDQSASASFLRQVDGTLDSAESRFRQFSTEAGRLVDQALSTQRNTAGSLDLGADQIRAAATAQQARAVAAREVAVATSAASRAEGDYSKNARLAVAATEALAREEEIAASKAMAHAAAVEQVQLQLNKTASATSMVVANTRSGTNAFGAVTNSVRAQRVAFVQLGQQMTDVVVQAQMGSRWPTIFVQQVPQMAFALSGMEGRVGSIASKLAGPLGAAIFGVTALAAPFIARLFEAGDASDELDKKSLSLADALAKVGDGSSAALKALKDYNAEQDRARDNADAMIKLNLAQADSDLRAAMAIREKLKAQQEALVRSSPQGATLAAGTIATQSGAQDAQIAALEQARRNLRIQDAQRDAKAAVDPDQALNNKYDDMAAAAARAAAGNEKLSHSLKGTLTTIERQRKLAVDAARAAKRGTGSAADANIGDMTALIQQLFPGVHITSTTGGKHVAGSDHPLGRAIDFVPSGGMGQYSTAQVREILTQAGVDIRRNRAGREQLFGPGDKGHSDHFHVAWEGNVDPERVAQRMARAQEQLAEFGDRSAESIARLNERFNEQPRLVDQAAQATRQLDQIITDLAEKKPAGFEQMIADAQAAKGVIDDALVRPFREMARDSERQVELQRLITQGREAEAEAVQTIWQMEERLGPLTAAQAQSVRDIVKARHDELEALQIIQERQSAYLDATRSVRSELEAIFAGHGNLGNFANIFRELKAKTTVEALFGPALRDLDKWIKRSPLDDSVTYFADKTHTAGDAAMNFADTLNAAARSIATGGAGASTSFAEAFSPQFFAELGGNGASATAGGTGSYDPVTNTFTVAAQKLDRSVVGLSPEAYFQRMAHSIAGPLLDGLDKTFHTQFFGKLQGAVAGGLYGYASAGVPGGILGGLKGALGDFGTDIFGPKLSGKIENALGGALKGAQTGTLVAGIGNMFGLKTSGIGAQLGGAIGSALPIPGGEIIGAISGMLWERILAGIQKGSVTIGGSGSSLGITGQMGKSSLIAASSKNAESIIGSIGKIADALGGTLDAAAGHVSIGVRNGKYTVDPTGSGQTKASFVKNFGEDAAAAVRYATMDLIRDGVITGIRASTARLLQAGDDLDKALQNAVDFENVFKELKRLKDPVSAALDDLDGQFGRLKDLFTEAGASTEEWNQLEELYWLKRDQTIKDATERSLSSLRGFLDELTIGNDALSLRDRKGAALAKFNPLADRVAAGDSTAYDDFASAARALLDIERQMSGSQQGYFDLLDRVTGLTQGALDGSAGAGFANRDSPFGARGAANDNAGVVDALGSLGDRIVEAIHSQGDATNTNLGAIIGNTQSQLNYGYGAIENGW